MGSLGVVNSKRFFFYHINIGRKTKNSKFSTFTQFLYSIHFVSIFIFFFFFLLSSINKADNGTFTIILALNNDKHVIGNILYKNA